MKNNLKNVPGFMWHIISTITVYIKTYDKNKQFTTNQNEDNKLCY